mgnify:CR=1 FL=1
MKARRHGLILSIIKEKPIETQEELGEALKTQGVEVTQATLSRDIKELGLIKLPTPNGDYRYSLPLDRNFSDLLKRAERIFEHAVLSIDFTENMIIIKTASGTAHAVAAALDDLDWKEVVGTIAGDDSILVIVRKKQQGKVVFG